MILPRLAFIINFMNIVVKVSIIVWPAPEMGHSHVYLVDPVFKILQNAALPFERFAWK